MLIVISKPSPIYVIWGKPIFHACLKFLSIDLHQFYTDFEALNLSIVSSSSSDSSSSNNVATTTLITCYFTLLYLYTVVFFIFTLSNQKSRLFLRLTSHFGNGRLVEEKVDFEQSRLFFPRLFPSWDEKWSTFAKVGPCRKSNFFSHGMRLTNNIPIRVWKKHIK